MLIIIAGHCVTTRGKRTRKTRNVLNFTKQMQFFRAISSLKTGNRLLRPGCTRGYEICIQNVGQVNCLHKLYIAAASDCAARREIRLRFKVFDFRCIRDALFTLHINSCLSDSRACSTARWDARVCGRTGSTFFQKLCYKGYWSYKSSERGRNLCPAITH